MKAEHDVGRLAELARAVAAGEAVPPIEPAWKNLRAAFARRARRRRLGIGALGLVVLAIAAIFPARALWVPRSGQALTCALDGVPMPPARYIPSVRADQADLRFSDGTAIALERASRAWVAATTAHGARIRLDDGRAHFSVVHRPDARWSVEAGPFVIVVTGTVFDVRWSGSDDLLQVHLRTGAVTVQGPLLGGGITLQPGQELEARPGAGALRIGRAETPAVIEPASPPPAEAPTPRAVRPAAAQARPAPSRPDGGRAAPDLGAGWGRQIASGDFAGVVEEAEAHGVESCLRSLPADRLAALADAARYTGRLDLARRALMARRDRFAGTAEAQDATFLLGRLADDRKQNDGALLWYETYLRQAPAGTYAAEAEARAMLILQATSQPARARAAARDYLQRHPTGPYAGQARHILQGAP